MLDGSVDSFVSMMNTKANELNLTNTNFTNTYGLDDERFGIYEAKHRQGNVCGEFKFFNGQTFSSHRYRRSFVRCAGIVV